MIICLDIGGSYIRAVMVDAAGNRAAEHRTATPTRSWAEFTRTLRTLGAEHPGVPMSLSMAGVIDRKSGAAKVANIPCLDSRQVEQELTAELGRPVIVTNDADCFALAEAHCGAGQGAATVFGIILGSGVGGGLVLGGKIHNGFGGISGEWGHGPVIDPTLGGQRSDLPSFDCGCGLTGCVDATGSARGLERLHRHLTGADLASKAITNAWRIGEVEAGRTIDLYCDLTARALSVVINTLGPDVIPVGGGLANETGLIGLIDEKVRQRTLAIYEVPLVVPGHHGADGGLLGAEIAGRQRLAAEDT